MLKLVFIDDSPLVLKSIKSVIEEFVEKKIIECSFYSDPVELYELCKEEKIEFDIIFTDINMPKMDGYEFIKRIKSIEKYRKKIVVAMTTEISLESKIKGRAAGMNGWITKIASPEVMKSTLKKWIIKEK